jgi:hypothetical protein
MPDVNSLQAWNGERFQVFRSRWSQAKVVPSWGIASTCAAQYPAAPTIAAPIAITATCRRRSALAARKMKAKRSQKATKLADGKLTPPTGLARLRRQQAYPRTFAGVEA